MENENFSIDADLLCDGNKITFQITLHQEKSDNLDSYSAQFNIFLENVAYGSVCVNEDNIWKPIDCKLPQNIVDIIGHEIENYYLED